MSGPMRIECKIHFEKKAKGRKSALAGEAPRLACAPGRVPRVAKLLALAHRFEAMVRDGLVGGYADLARLAGVTRSRVSQITGLLNLAPDIQEAVLFLPRTTRGRDPIQMYHLLPVAAVHDWKTQRRLFGRLVG
jgi:hypothetical protein